MSEVRAHYPIVGGILLSLSANGLEKKNENRGVLGNGGGSAYAPSTPRWKVNLKCKEIDKKNVMKKKQGGYFGHPPHVKKILAASLKRKERLIVGLDSKH